jgi:hypothetical protein
MSDRNNNSNARERTSTVKEADRQAAKTSAYTPKVTIEKLNRNVPSDIQKKNKNINDHPVKVPIYYSTISVASACIILTVIFSVCIVSDFYLEKISKLN